MGLGLYGLRLLLFIFHSKRPSVFKLLELSQCKEGCDRKERPRASYSYPITEGGTSLHWVCHIHNVTATGPGISSGKFRVTLTSDFVV